MPEEALVPLCRPRSQVGGEEETMLTLHCYRQNESASRWAAMRAISVFHLLQGGKIAKQYTRIHKELQLVSVFKEFKFFMWNVLKFVS